MNLTISGFSTALYSTFYLVEELGILFDCGDGASMGLLQKSGKVKHIFISHADRDHLTGLTHFLQLNANKDNLKIYYPKDCGSFPALNQFLNKFDPHISHTHWIPLTPNEKVQISKGIYVQAILNTHVQAADGQFKSLSYRILEERKKLKSEYLSLSGTEIVKLKSSLTEDKLYQIEVKVPLYFSADCPVENFEYWNDAEILIHESTFIGLDEDANIKTHGNKHSNLKELLNAVAKSNVKNLVIGHFSCRYKSHEIEVQVSELTKHFNINIPVHLVLPGQIIKNLNL